MSTYKDFVREFLAAEKAKGNTDSPTQRMAACAAAWRQKHPKEEKVTSKASASKVKKVKNEPSATASRKKPLVFSGLEIGSMLMPYKPSESQDDEESTSTSVPKHKKVFTIRKTKTNQRQLNNAVRAFAKDVKTGSVTNVNDAFARGLKCFYELHHQ